MDSMHKAYRIAAAAVRQRLLEQKPEDLAILNRVSRGDVVAYSGSYDQAEKVFECLGISVEKDKPSSRLKAKIVFVNCSSSFKNLTPSDITLFVHHGGWLVTSDWALDHLLEPAFPGMVRWNRRSTGEMVVSVEPFLDSLWSEVVVLGADPQWWLWGSHTIEIVNPQQVKIEAASHDMLARFGSPVVAVQFPWGRGNVFHVIAHFWAKKSGTPVIRHIGPCTDFLTAGMRLSEAGIEKVLREANVNPTDVNFGMLQSAVTATELVAQLCIRAKGGG
jgi:hypothetical protein